MTIDVDALPRRRLLPGSRLFRIHSVINDPVWISNTGAGRFDPIGTTGRGSWYLAEDPLGAWIETFRTVMLIDEADVYARALTTITIDSGFEVVDLTERIGLAAGVTTALTSGSDYTESQALATALQGVVDGVRWRVRHDLSQEAIGMALFGDAGNRGGFARLPATTAPIPLSLIDEAEATFGYRVLPRP